MPRGRRSGAPTRALAGSHPPQLSASTITPNSTLDVTVTVRNSGGMAGKETVLLYLSDEYREITPEEKLLRRFEKVALAPGASTAVTFRLTVEDLLFYGIADEHTPVYELGTFVVSVGGLSATFELVA